MTHVFFSISLKKFLDLMIIERKCIQSELSTPLSCKKGENCSVCNSDECNSAIQYGPAAVIVAIPITIMKIFSLL